MDKKTIAIVALVITLILSLAWPGYIGPRLADANDLRQTKAADGQKLAERAIEIDRLTQERDAARKKFTALEADLGAANLPALKSKMKTLRKENDALKNSIAQIASNQATALADRDATTGERDKENTRLRKDLSDKTKQLEALRINFATNFVPLSMNEDMKTQVRNLKAEIEGLKQKNTTLQEDVQYMLTDGRSLPNEEETVTTEFWVLGLPTEMTDVSAQPVKKLSFRREVQNTQTGLHMIASATLNCGSYDITCDQAGGSVTNRHIVRPGTKTVWYRQVGHPTWKRFERSTYFALSASGAYELSFTGREP